MNLQPLMKIHSTGKHKNKNKFVVRLSKYLFTSLLDRMSSQHHTQLIPIYTMLHIFRHMENILGLYIQIKKEKLFIDFCSISRGNMALCAGQFYLKGHIRFPETNFLLFIRCSRTINLNIFLYFLCIQSKSEIILLIFL